MFNYMEYGFTFKLVYILLTYFHGYSLVLEEL